MEVTKVIDATRDFRVGEVETHALRGVNLDIASGELLALLGPSGSGKTTLLRAIAGLEMPDEGHIKLDGTVLFESNLILDYLLTRYPDTPAGAPNPPLLPSLVRPERRWEDSATLVAIETMLNSGLTMLRFGTHSGVAQDPPYLAREHQRPQREHGHGAHGLRGADQAARLPAVGQHAAEQR